MAVQDAHTFESRVGPVATTGDVARGDDTTEQVYSDDPKQQRQRKWCVY